ncbi:unnamed protein product [Lactuca virosa]|uniref:Glycosyltransferase n=1 Tax=Lactuca virosa TaxID=75947 RepID=A0AAU9P9H0_9ASTR|nr:unnamed protein product [Lactuca virosa]
MEAKLRRHVVMVPFMAKGHLLPFLELAHRILHHNANLTITIVSTPLNINYLRSAIANDPTPPPQIHLRSLPFNSSDHGLPPNSESTEGLTFTQIIKLFYASTTLEAPLREFISDVIVKEGTAPACIISDNFMGWANEVARSFGTVNYTFTTGGAYGTTAFCSICMNLPQRNIADGGTHDHFPVPGFPESFQFSITQHHPYYRAADGKDEWSIYFLPQLSHCLQSNGWLCHTVEEIETTGCEALRNFTKLPLWCTGPLLPSKMLKTNSGMDTASGVNVIGNPEKCIKWLDSHARGSVLYVSFGSQNTLSETQMMELAQGLEESKKSFIWVIRPPIGFDIKSEFKPEWLPSGFEDRIRNQGLLVHNWAPQLDILCHQSTGAFLSHCGWNSVMESLSQGVPLIGWPLAAEQGFNAKMLVEEMGVCVVLRTGVVDSTIGKEEVKKVIEVVLDKNEDGKGNDMRKKATELRKLMHASVNGSSYKAMADFVSTFSSI